MQRGRRFFGRRLYIGPGALLFCCLLLVLKINTGHAAHSRRRTVVASRGAVDGNNNSDRYDRSVTTFDPTGRLLQVEYAQQAAARGKSVAAVMVGDAIYVAVVVAAAAAAPSSGAGAAGAGSSSGTKVHRIAEHVWLVGAGLAGDVRAVAAHLRVQAQQHVLGLGEPWTVPQAAAALAALQHQLTHTPGARPLGVACLVLGGGGNNCNNNSSNNNNPAAQQRLYKCSPGGVKEDCLYCSAGQSDGSILKALQECFEQFGDASPKEAAVIEGLVAAVRKGLGFKTYQNDDDREPILDVWVIRSNGNKRGKTDTTCFAGLCGDEDSLAKMQAHYESSSSPPQPKQED